MNAKLIIALCLSTSLISCKNSTSQSKSQNKNAPSTTKTEALVQTKEATTNPMPETAHIQLTPMTPLADESEKEAPVSTTPIIVPQVIVVEKPMVEAPIQTSVPTPTEAPIQNNSQPQTEESKVLQIPTVIEIAATPVAPAVEIPKIIEPQENFPELKIPEQVLELEDIQFDSHRTDAFINAKSIKEMIANSNQYEIEVSVPEKKKLDQGILECSLLTGELVSKFSETSFINGSKAKLKIDISKLQNQENDIQCELKENGHSIFSNLNLHLNKDIIITSPTTIMEQGLIEGENNVGALIIASTGSLKIGGFNLQINANQFNIEEGGKIITLDENDIQSFDGKDGTSGGVLQLNAINASGILSAELRGQDAGKQINVRVPTVAGAMVKGFSGHNGGNTGSIHIKTSTPDNIILNHKAIVYSAGKGSDGGITSLDNQEGDAGTTFSNLFGNVKKKILCLSIFGKSDSKECKPQKTISGIKGDSGENGEIQKITIESL